MTWKVLSDERTAPPPPDLAERRRQRLGLIVESRRAVRLDELSAELGVSQSTVRRDLDELASTVPAAKTADPARFIDDRYVKELEASGFIAGLYK